MVNEECFLSCDVHNMDHQMNVLKVIAGIFIYEEISYDLGQVCSIRTFCHRFRPLFYFIYGPNITR